MGREPVVAGGDAAEVVQTTEHALNGVAGAIESAFAEAVTI